MVDDEDLPDISYEEARRGLRRLELQAYASIANALRAQGDLCDEKKQLLQEICCQLGISTERYRAELRRVANDDILTAIAAKLSGPSSSKEWLFEGRRLAPVVPRLVPQTAFTSVASAAAAASIQVANSKPIVSFAASVAVSCNQDPRNMLVDSSPMKLSSDSVDKDATYVAAEKEDKHASVPARSKRRRRSNVAHFRQDPSDLSKAATLCAITSKLSKHTASMTNPVEALSRIMNPYMPSSVSGTKTNAANNTTSLLKFSSPLKNFSKDVKAANTSTSKQISTKSISTTSVDNRVLSTAITQPTTAPTYVLSPHIITSITKSVLNGQGITSTNIKTSSTVSKGKNVITNSSPGILVSSAGTKVSSSLSSTYIPNKTKVRLPKQRSKANKSKTSLVVPAMIKPDVLKSISSASTVATATIASIPIRISNVTSSPAVPITVTIDSKAKSVTMPRLLKAQGKQSSLATTTPTPTSLLTKPVLTLTKPNPAVSIAATITGRTIPRATISTTTPGVNIPITTIRDLQDQSRKLSESYNNSMLTTPLQLSCEVKSTAELLADVSQGRALSMTTSLSSENIDRKVSSITASTTKAKAGLHSSHIQVGGNTIMKQSEKLATIATLSMQSSSEAYGEQSDKSKIQTLPTSSSSLDNTSKIYNEDNGGEVEINNVRSLKESNDKENNTSKGEEQSRHTAISNSMGSSNTTAKGDTAKESAYENLNDCDGDQTTIVGSSGMENAKASPIKFNKPNSLSDDEYEISQSNASVMPTCDHDYCIDDSNKYRIDREKNKALMPSVDNEWNDNEENSQNMEENSQNMEENSQNMEEEGRDECMLNPYSDNNNEIIGHGNLIADREMSSVRLSDKGLISRVYETTSNDTVSGIESDHPIKSDESSSVNQRGSSSKNDAVHNRIDTINNNADVVSTDSADKAVMEHSYDVVNIENDQHTSEKPCSHHCSEQYTVEKSPSADDNSLTIKEDDRSEKEVIFHETPQTNQDDEPHSTEVKFANYSSRALEDNDRHASEEVSCSHGPETVQDHEQQISHESPAFDYGAPIVNLIKEQSSKVELSSDATVTDNEEYKFDKLPSSSNSSQGSTDVEYQPIDERPFVVNDEQIVKDNNEHTYGRKLSSDNLQIMIDSEENASETLSYSDNGSESINSAVRQRIEILHPGSGSSSPEITSGSCKCTSEEATSSLYPQAATKNDGSAQLLDSSPQPARTDDGSISGKLAPDGEELRFATVEEKFIPKEPSPPDSDLETVEDNNDEIISNALQSSNNGLEVTNDKKEHVLEEWSSSVLKTITDSEQHCPDELRSSASDSQISSGVVLSSCREGLLSNDKPPTIEIQETVALDVTKNNVHSNRNTKEHESSTECNSTNKEQIDIDNTKEINQDCPNGFVNVNVSHELNKSNLGSSKVILKKGKNSKRKKKFDAHALESDGSPVTQNWIKIASKILHRICRFKGSGRQKGDYTAASWFLRPVQKDHAPGYYDIITNPMDFSTIRKKLENGFYSSYSEFNQDMELIKSNCHLYNPPDHVIRKDCDEVFEFYAKEYKRLLAADRETEVVDEGNESKRLKVDVE